MKYCYEERKQQNKEKKNLVFIYYCQNCCVLFRLEIVLYIKIYL